MNKLLVVLSIILAGCAFAPSKPLPIITPNIIHIDPRALEPCNNLIQLSPTASFEELLGVLVSNAEIYLDCKNKQNNSIILLKEFSNKKDYVK